MPTPAEVEPAVTWYSMLKDFVGPVGALVGILLAAFLYYRNSRKIEQAKRDQERKDLANGLAAELNDHKRDLEAGLAALIDNETMMRDADIPRDTRGTFRFPKYTSPNLSYQEAKKKIGILPADTIVKVTKAYTASERLPVTIAQFCR